MKRIYLYMLAGSLSLAGFTSCDDAENPVLDNAIYIEDAELRDEYDCLVRPMRDVEYNVTVRMTQKLDHDVTVTLAIDENLLKEHFEKFEEELTLLPEESRTLLNADGTPCTGNRVTVTIPANQTSAIVPVQIRSYSGSASQYALPISIEHVSEDIKLLRNLRSACYVFQAPFTTPVLFVNGGSNVFTALNGLPSTNNWTVEFHYAIEVGVGDSLWGCPLFEVSDNGGECIYVRQYRPGSMDIHLRGTFGVGSYDLSDIGMGDLYTNAANQGRWCHFALVCENGSVTSYLNGVAMNTVSSSQFEPAYNFSHLSLCGMYQRGRIGFSEVRIWSVARTLPQLTRFKYDVSPEAPGLLAYYKLNEGEGAAVLKDLSPYGNDIDISEQFEVMTNEDGLHMRNDVYWGVAGSDDDFVSLRTVEW